MNESTLHRPRAANGHAAAQDWLGSNQDPDVFLSVPDLQVEKLGLVVEELDADVDLHARVLDLVELNVGARVTLGKVELDLENVRAQAMLKVKLDKVAEIVERVMKAVDDHPELVTSLTSAVGDGVLLAGDGVRTSLRGLEGRPGWADTRPIEDVHATGDGGVPALAKALTGAVPDAIRWGWRHRWLGLR